MVLQLVCVFAFFKVANTKKKKNVYLETTIHVSSTVEPYMQAAHILQFSEIIAIYC